MKIWRMSFRVGIQGHEMWPNCYELGVAAMTYYPLAEVNLSLYPKNEPKELWSELAPSQKASLRRVAYEMKACDIIYVKQGPRIVGKGIVQDSYQFDSKYRIIDTNKVPWAHQVPVKWESDFSEIRILLGSEQLTVKELSRDKIDTLNRAVLNATKTSEEKEALEGELFNNESTFRSRNQALINAKKINSDYRCEICGFSFQEKYGSMGKEYIIAHHIKALSSRPTSSITKQKDIVLVCANCHAMIHTKNPPVLPQKLRELLQ